MMLPNLQYNMIFFHELGLFRKTQMESLIMEYYTPYSEGSWRI